MFKLQSPSKYFSFGAVHQARLFSIAQNSFWTHRVWCLLVSLLFFVSPLPHQQNGSLEDFFHLGKQKKVAHRGTPVKLFFIKNCWIFSAGWAGALVNYPSWNGQTHWESLQKNLLKLNVASHNNASWYAATDGFLEHSPSGGSLYYRGPALQKIILGFFWQSPPFISLSLPSYLTEYNIFSMFL